MLDRSSKALSRRREHCNEPESVKGTDPRTSPLSFAVLAGRTPAGGSADTTAPLPNSSRVSEATRRPSRRGGRKTSRKSNKSATALVSTREHVERSQYTLRLPFRWEASVHRNLSPPVPPRSRFRSCFSSLYALATMGSPPRAYGAYTHPSAPPSQATASEASPSSSSANNRSCANLAPSHSSEQRLKPGSSVRIYRPLPRCPIRTRPRRLSVARTS